jgi:hypothetical protein
MSATETRLRGKTRWSMACKCPRMAVYALRGEEPHEPSDRSRRLMARGRQLGEWMGRRFQQRYGADNVVLEKPVLWPNGGLPVGELHTDVFVKPERMAVEVKSTAQPESLIDSALTQLAGEVHFDPDADKGLLAIVDPNDLAEELLPFRLTDEKREQVEAIARQVVDAGTTGELPARVCEKPSDGLALFCPFIDTCFADWTPPLPETLDSNELRGLVYQAAGHKHTRDALQDRVEEADAAYRRDLERLAAHLEPGVDYQVGSISIRRTVVKGRTTYRIPAALKCGVVSEEQLAPFTKIGEPHERWTIEGNLTGFEPDDEYDDSIPF